MTAAPFPTLDVLSVATGVLMAEIGGVYRVLGHMTGEAVFTHQIPRIAEEALPVLLALHPTLQQAIDESGQVSPETYAEWRDLWLDRYGPELAVPVLTADQHEFRDPLSEAAERFRPDQLAVVALPEAGAQ